MPKPTNKNATNKPEVKRFFQLRAKRKDECVECETTIYQNDRTVYDAEEKKIYCAKCGEDLLS